MKSTARWILALGALSCAGAALPLRAAEAEPAARSGETVYRVQPGDSLWVLSRRFDVPVRELARRNGIGNARRLRVGSEIVIPSRKPAEAVEAEAEEHGPDVHVVARGDSLYALARLYGVSAKELAQANGIRNPRRLRPGQRLRIPGASQQDATPPVPPARLVPPAPPAPPAPSAPFDVEERDPMVVALATIKLRRAQAMLDAAQEDYLRADFEAALDRMPDLDRLLDALPAGSAVREHRARAAFLTGASLAGLGRNDEAVASFARAYAADPDLEPDPALTSPRLAELLDAARDAGGR